VLIERRFIVAVSDPARFADLDSFIYISRRFN
jgi:hypothetical protein